jgi:glycosyltransferase involved in cell wall biosynthesis
VEEKLPGICFVNSDNYPVLNPEYGDRYIGGESVQQTLLAKEFVRSGWNVSMVCEDFGQPDGEIIDGIKVWKTYESNSGIPVFRFFYPRLYSTWRALSRAKADAYFQSCAGVTTGIVAKFANVKKKKMIFRVAHDTDCIRGEQLIRFARDRRIYEYGLREAGVISSQSEVQKRLLEENYGLDSIVTNMVVEIPEDSARSHKDIDVLWVNNLRDFKRPDIVCDIARRMPDISFTMIGGAVSGFEKLHEDIIAESRTIPNLNYIGAVPYHEVNAYFARCKLFLNTSDSEGFPNSFLQAWIRHVPVVSYFDPDSIISSREFGVSPDSTEDACNTISKLVKDDTQRRIMGDRAAEYVMTNFSPEAIVRKYVGIIGRDVC